MPDIIHLSIGARRAAVASALTTATGDLDPLAAIAVADVLDAVSAAVLRSVGVADEDARAVLALLWSGR